MRCNSLRFTVISLGCLVVGNFSPGHSVLAQEPQPAAREEARLTVTVEPFCSDTKLRTSNARIRWSMPGEALAATGMKSLVEANQSLEATVYKNGFQKGLLVSVPLSQATHERPLAAHLEGKNAKLRAFQFSVIEVGPSKETGQPKAELAAAGGGEMSAVVEGLEPGVNYTWRIAVETTSGRIVSAPASGEASVCPADMVPTTAVPRRKS
jgi:hypothetical protein